MDTTPYQISSSIESEFNSKRDRLEQQYNRDLTTLASKFDEDIQANHKAKEQALVNAGLNSDGTAPDDWVSPKADPEPALSEETSPPAA